MMAERRATLIVGIVGASGSGKTTLAERLREELGGDAAVIAHDSYYKHLPDMTPEQAADYDFDCPDALDTHLLVEHLSALAAGEAVYVPAYDFAAHARVDRARLVEPARVVIVEGLFVMCEAELADLLDLTVFVDGEQDVIALRRVRRDCAERGATLDRAIEMYLRFTKPAYRRYVAPCRERADIVIRDACDDAAVSAVIGEILRRAAELEAPGLQMRVFLTG